MNDIENSLKQKTKTKENTCGFSYDAYGRPVSCGNDIHEQTIAYDKFGNIASVAEKIDGLTFSKSISYDKKGRPESTTSPTGLDIRLNYDPYSNVDAIQCNGNQFWRLTDTDESGKPTKETYGGIIRTTKYDNRGLPILDDVAKLMHYEYLFDTNGDMLQKKETYSKQEEVYLFDQHNRLNIWRTFEKDTLRKEIFASYDDIFGNMTSRSDSDFVFNYGEFGLSPHALTSIDAPIRGHERENSYTYTDFKMLESATNGVDSIFITYGVDFQRRRMKIFKNDSLILTRYYFSDYEEEHYADGRVRKIDYITGPTGLIGVNISTDGVDTLLYAFTDRFGNLVMLVDDKGNVVERLAYDPWGARRNPGDWTKPDTASHLLSRGYSMHEHIDCLGLINMNARVYEPATCSFLSPDPLIADEGNWLNYNRYLYCLGNPVKYADPTGMQIVTPSDLPLTGPTGVVPQNGGWFGIVNMNWTYDDYSQSYIMSYGFSDFVVNGTNNSNDYFVNYALSGNAAYASSITADHKNAIDWQIANASAKAMEGVNVGGQGWNRFGNINNGVAFVSSSAFEYVSKSLNKSLEYFTEGVSTTKDIHFKIPDIEIKGWKCPHFNVYIHNVGFVSNVASAAKFLGKLTGYAGLAMTGYEIFRGQKSWLGEGGLDLVMGAVGFIPGWGWAVSGAYFGGKMILESTGNKFW